MSKRLYSVTITIPVVVMADDPREACRMARAAAHREEADIEAVALEADDHLRLPLGWDTTCIPYGLATGDDRTIGDILRGPAAEHSPSVSSHGAAGRAGE